MFSFLIYREKSDDFIWQLTRQFCWDFVNHLQLACVKRQIKGNFMNGLIIPYNVNKYTQAFVRREGMHFVMSLNYCWYIIFVHFHWGWLRLSEFCLFIFMVLGSLTIKILVNQVLFHPTSPWGCGAKKVWSFYPLFLLLLSRAMQNPNMILRLLPCILPHRRISYRSNEAVRLERANRVQVSS